MTLVDTSAWIDHFRRSDPDLIARLQAGTVASHPFVIGELALGNLTRRAEILELIRALPVLEAQPHEVVLAFVHRHELAGTGVGWVDVHLLAAAEAEGAALFSNDRRLRTQAARLGLAAR